MGLYHVSSGRLSKFALLQLLREAYGLDITVEPDESFVLDRSLLGAKLESAIGYNCPAWSTMLTQLANDPTPYQLPSAMSA